jgi:NNP family nitrate/nitrite transporter-like MFS transporter
MSKSNRIELFSLRTPQMRAFHLTWLAFFVCFYAWFACAPLMPVVAMRAPASVLSIV